jgi:hypothetical protein
MTTSREELIALISAGGIPAKAEANIARVRRCLQEVLARLPAMLAAMHGADARPPLMDGTGLAS